MAWFAHICQLTVVATFLLSSLSKVRSAAAFASAREAVNTIGRVPVPLGLPVAALLVVAELALAAGASVPITARWALAAATVVLVAFIVLIATTMRRRPGTTCACFGRSDAPLGIRHIARNAVLAMIAALGFIVDGRADTGTSAGTLAGWAVCAVAAGVIALVIAVWDDISDVFVPAPRARR